MSKYIDVQLTKAAIYKKWGGDPAYYISDSKEGQDAATDARILELLDNAEKMVIIEADIIETDPSPHKWKPVNNGALWVCPVCNRYEAFKSNYCPTCGALMKNWKYKRLKVAKGIEPKGEDK